MIKQLKNKKLLLVLVGVLILLVAIGGGYFYFTIREKPNDNGNNQNNNNQTTNQPNYYNTDLGDGWLKYENLDYGFSLEIPKKLDINKFVVAMAKNSHQDTFYTLDKNECKEISCNISFFLSDFIDSEDYKTVKEYLDNATDYYDEPGKGVGKTIERREFLINNIRVILQKEAGEYFNHFVIWFPNYEKNYIVTMVIAEKNYDTELFQRIFNSVRFSE